MATWLMKSEPSAYSISDLARETITLWDGIRNYQARNHMRTMQPGELVFFYHSNARPTGIVGEMEVIETGVIDPSQFDTTSPYFDPASSPERPRWDCARLRHRRTYPGIIDLPTLRETFTPEEFILVRRGNRLSVLPVPDSVAERILAMIPAGA
ncbi:EVE domain-containing protein [Synechococcus sp. RSCCF101]|uniref:EVE domain-containing protein n=1 Tax=Synechococcus sp. RSCCF101 TaxID=2511069 RepID=UPI0012465810|nr:EVE domain-containing protein [Synechococcus sp. RSCCF101]QEY33153.1 EVE domain-containing protein [Synechococcus sp. RSCCF101]